MPPHLASFVFLVETGFLHVGQDGLDLLISGDLPNSASQRAAITGVRRHTPPSSFEVFNFQFTTTTIPVIIITIVAVVFSLQLALSYLTSS